MEGAGEGDTAAALEAAKNGAAVAARVDEGVQLAMVAARNEDGLVADISCEVVLLGIWLSRAR